MAPLSRGLSLPVRFTLLVALLCLAVVLRSAHLSLTSQHSITASEPAKPIVADARAAPREARRWEGAAQDAAERELAGEPEPSGRGSARSADVSIAAPQRSSSHFRQPPPRPPLKARRRLPPTLEDRVDLSVIVQFFNAPGRFRHVGIRPLVEGYRRCANSSGLSVEVLVNVDSRDHADGNVREWLDVLGESDFALLSPNVHELRGYNRLAWMARGAHLLFVQDDEAPNPQVAVYDGYDTCGWLANATRVLRLREEVGVVGLQENAIHHVSPGVHTQCPTYTESERPRCFDPRVGVRTEAVLCSPAGPLLVRREAFTAVRGFDERGASKGVLGAIYVDCELQARMWLAGWATVYLTRYLTDVNQWPMKFLLEIAVHRPGEATRPLAEKAIAAPDVPESVRVIKPHLAWEQPGSCQQTKRAARFFDAAYQNPATDAFAAIFGAMRAFNARELRCAPSAELAWDPRAPLGPVDCGMPMGNVTAALGGACARAVAAAAREPAASAKRRARACADGSCLSPWTAAAEAVELSVVLQYFNAPGRAHELAIQPLVAGYAQCARAAGVRAELLVNVDSRAHALGDAPRWIAALGGGDYALLSPSVHELRGYNRLAWMARGEYVLFAQDDDGVPGACAKPGAYPPVPPVGAAAAAAAQLRQRAAPTASPPAGRERGVQDAAWLAGPLALLRAHGGADVPVPIKVASFNAVLFYVPHEAARLPSREQLARAGVLSRALPGPRGGARSDDRFGYPAAPRGLTHLDFGLDSLRDGKGHILQPRCNATAEVRVQPPGGAGAAAAAPAHVPVELAVEAARCADMGPLLLERAAFVDVGGFNETMAARGQAGSVAVDCELEARLWAAGFATVAAMPRTQSGRAGWAAATQMRGVARHVAWKQHGMGKLHSGRVREYGARFEQPGSDAVLELALRAHAVNARFACGVPTGRAQRAAPGPAAFVPHAPLDCLISAEHDACRALDPENKLAAA